MENERRLTSIKKGWRRHFRSMLAAVGLSLYAICGAETVIGFVEQGGIGGRPQAQSYSDDYKEVLKNSRASQDSRNIKALGFFAAGTALLYGSLSMRGEYYNLQEASKQEAGQEVDLEALIGPIYRPRYDFSKN